MKWMMRIGVGFIISWLLFIKLFTSEIHLVDDTTVGIIVRDHPSFVNFRSYVSEKESEQMHYLIADENEYLGQGTYRFIVGLGWLPGVFFGGIFLLGGVLIDIARSFRPRSHKNLEVTCNHCTH